MSTPQSNITNTTKQDDIQSHLPDLPQFFPELAALFAAVHEATRNGSIPQITVGLAQLRAGQLVGSTYHTVRVAGGLREAGEADDRITAVATFRDSHFTEAARVALEPWRAALTPNPSEERIPDQLFRQGLVSPRRGRSPC